MFGKSSKSLLTCYCVNICYFPLKGNCLLQSALEIRLLNSLKSLEQSVPVLFSWNILCFLLSSEKTKLERKISFFPCSLLNCASFRIGSVNLWISASNITTFMCKSCLYNQLCHSRKCPSQTLFVVGAFILRYQRAEPSCRQVSSCHLFYRPSLWAASWVVHCPVREEVEAAVCRGGEWQAASPEQKLIVRPP